MNSLIVENSSIIPGVHFWHVSMHFFQVFLWPHFPFFFRFMHFFVLILSLQLALRIEFLFSETNKKNGILLPKLFWPTVRKNCSNSERSEQFLVTECFFNLFLEVFQISYIRIIRIQIGKNKLVLETYRKS